MNLMFYKVYKNISESEQIAYWKYPCKRYLLYLKCNSPRSMLRSLEITEHRCDVGSLQPNDSIMLWRAAAWGGGGVGGGKG